MQTLEQRSGDALGLTVHWMWWALEFAATYTWPLLLLGAAVATWRALSRK